MNALPGYNPYQKPLVGAQLDRSRPHVPTAAWLFNEGSGKGFDLCGSGSGFRPNTAATIWNPDADGPAIYSGALAAANGWVAPDCAGAKPTNGITVAVSFLYTAFAGGSGCIAYRNNPAVSAGYNGGWAFAVNGSSKMSLSLFVGGASVAAPTPPLVSTGIKHVAALTYDGSFVRGYLDGVLFGSAAATGLLTYTASSIFCLGDLAYNEATGWVNWLQIYDHALPLAAIQGLKSDPYSIVQAPATRRMFAFRSGTSYAASIAESSTGVDSYGVTVTFSDVVTESSTAIDVQSSLAAFATALAQSVTATDTNVALASISATLNEGPTATDSNTVVATFAASFTESTTASDGNTAPSPGSSTIIETVTASDSYTAVAGFSPSLAESATAFDSQTATAIFQTGLTESTTATDGNTAPAPGSASITESITASDSYVAAALFATAFNESLACSDGVAALPAGGVTISESITASDSYVAMAVFRDSISESAATNTLFIGINPSGILSFKESVAAALKSDSTLNALISGRINPSKIGQLKAYPALMFQVTNRTWDNDLDGATGTAEATVEFTAYATDYATPEHITLAVRNIFDGFQGTMSGVVMNYILASDDDDDYSPADNASDRGTFTDSITITFGYMIAKPVR
jgi:hypothetical protein